METPQHLKHLILHSKEPFLIKNYVDWKIITWSLEDWQNELKNLDLVFRSGEKLFTKEPQWERTTTTQHATFKDFLLITQLPETEKWMYFDYKYLKDWFINVSELKNSIKWDRFGFPELSTDDSTIWIGSAGAHTPCHIDTYGCNIVVQIYGRKQWILCPPEENLKPTRIPYEESSIYSSLNFFSPTIDDFKGVENCRRIILEPGDVLIVPHKWWHYVENLEVAISINAWLPLPVDDEERLQESLIQMFMSQIAASLDKEGKESILNPNSDEEIGRVTFNTSLDLIKLCKNSVLRKRSEAESEGEISSLKLEAELGKCRFLQKIPVLSGEEFLEFLQQQRNRFKNEDQGGEINKFGDLFDLVNAFTNPGVISLVKNQLLNKV